MQQEDEIDLKELFFELKKHWLMILLSVIVGAGAFGAYTKLLIVPQYTSTSMVYIVSKETTLTSLADLQIGSQLTKDYSVIVNSRPVLQKTLDSLKITDMTYKQLKKKVSVDNPKDTRIMSLTITDPDPYTAKALVDAMAKTSVQYIADIMEMTPPKIIEDGEIASEKSSPNTIKNILMGGMLGGLLACGIIVLLSVMNDTIKTEDDIEKYLGLTVLGSIPDWEKKSKRGYGSYGYGYGYGPDDKGRKAGAGKIGKKNRKR
ncbi:MAG: Wzz/FepE/Etk N-terminal domain-containing protein [Lachnospiraceae bacterium]|nr:Wzz/FepE/Etk N-terminal domain-containing protein [Lachnospiraceae bacterium]